VFYRETGQFKTSYRRDQAIFPIAQDRWSIGAIIVIAYLVIPVMANEYWLQAILIPFLIFALAALGLNLLTGHAGQLSLGTGGFMAVGAYAAYKMTTAFPDVPILLVLLLSGVFAAAVGLIFGLPSLRIKGLYLAVATLAAQFFLIWLFNRVAWFYNYNPSGTITAPPRTFLGIMITGPEATATVRYLVALSFLILFALVAKNLVRSEIGRTWMAIRDMDVAAEIIGIRPLTTKLSAFATSSFYCGVAGALLLFLYLGSVETLAFDITVSFDAGAGTRGRRESARSGLRSASSERRGDLA
jgi:branched-chain amino acid transport system permease protein